MRKLFIVLAAFMLVMSCSTKKPVEVQIPQENVELTGNGFQIFQLAGDLKMVLVQNPDNGDEWMIRASAPLMKVSEDPLGAAAITVNLLDENGMKLRDDFFLSAEELDNLIPKFNAEKDVENNIVFSASEDSRKYFSYKEAADLLSRTRSVAMNVSLLQSLPAVQTVVDQKKDEPVTFNSLMEKHGIYGMLSQYERAWKNKEKKKAKQIEDKLYEICKKVKADPLVPASVAKRFRDYIEDKEDEIEGKH